MAVAWLLLPALLARHRVHTHAQTVSIPRSRTGQGKSATLLSLTAGYCLRCPIQIENLAGRMPASPPKSISVGTSSVHHHSGCFSVVLSILSRKPAVWGDTGVAVHHFVSQGNPSVVITRTPNCKTVRRYRDCERTGLRFSSMALKVRDAYRS